MKLENLKLRYDYLKLDELFYDKVQPQGLKQPFLIDLNEDLAKELGLDLNKDEFAKLINADNLPENFDPFAMVYAGHQFGFYVPRLGDGRAINLGKLNGYNLQLKGAGITRYSRDGDGRAVLRSSIREYLMSEAMHHLGVATTRAVGIIGSNHRVYRGEWESGSIVLRASESWIRIGSFEYFYYEKKYKHLQALLDFTINESFSHLLNDDKRYIKMFEEVVEKTAKLFAKWMSIGFNHGVLNSDNTSIAGLSIDYGPFAFLDDYNPDFICNHTDRDGRYSFKNQPQIGYTNLTMLATALSPLINLDLLKKALLDYEKIFNAENLRLLREKLGLQKSYESDKNLIDELFLILQNQRIDYTYFFRTLSSYKGDRQEILSIMLTKKALDIWLDEYDSRLVLEDLNHTQRTDFMKKTNPKYILKNYILQEAIDKAENGDFSGVKDLMKLAKSPFDEHSEFERYAKPTPAEFKNLKLSCSS
jgi:uncharacterized protein YdiU (UPF0061 family)